MKEANTRRYIYLCLVVVLLSIIITTEAEDDRLFCIRHHKYCGHRPKRCCSGLFCRCNTFGTNCRCQSKGALGKLI
uniref:Xibalbin-13 2 n=1 Tax=Xibalbanus tulumensis TaxID=1519145 RepID=XIBD2_XIBTU